jgi:hypothetical protein
MKYKGFKRVLSMVLTGALVFGMIIPYSPVSIVQEAEANVQSIHTYTWSWQMPAGSNQTYNFPITMNLRRNETISLAFDIFSSNSAINMEFGFLRSGTLHALPRVTTTSGTLTFDVLNDGVHQFRIRNTTTTNSAWFIVVQLTVKTNPTTLRYFRDPTLGSLGINSFVNDIEIPFETRWDIRYARITETINIPGVSGGSRLAGCPNHHNNDFCECSSTELGFRPCHTNAGANIDQVRGWRNDNGRVLSNVLVSTKKLCSGNNCRPTVAGSCGGALGVALPSGKWTYTNFTWTTNRASQIGTIWHEMSHMYGVSESTSRPCQPKSVRMCIMNGGFDDRSLAQIQALSYVGSSWNIWCIVCTNEFRPHLH